MLSNNSDTRYLNQQIVLKIQPHQLTKETSIKIGTNKEISQRSCKAKANFQAVEIGIVVGEKPAITVEKYPYESGSPTNNEAG